MNGMKKALLAALTLLTAVSMTACSGSSGDFGSTATPGVTKGVITAFGSVFVNGVEFKTANANLNLPDDPTLSSKLVAEDDVKTKLKVGMVVSIKGTSDAKNGTATEIEFRDNLEAKIGIKDDVARTLTINGVKIVTDDATKIHGLDDSVITFANIPATAKLEVSGLPDDKGGLRATFIKVKHDNPQGEFEQEIKGFIVAINGTTSFDLGMALGIKSITVLGDIKTTLPSAAIGNFVEVKLNAAGVMTKVEVENELHAAENEKVSIEGFVSATTTPDEFVVNGQRVLINTQTVFLGGIKANIAIGRKLEAEGPIAGGIMTAVKISFKVVNSGLSTGTIEKFGSLFVNGVEFKTLGAKLHLRDDKTTPERVLKTETEIATLLKSGMIVTVKGGINDDGITGIAQEIEFRNAMEGTIDDKGVDFITVMGQKIIVDDSIKTVLGTLKVGDKVGISGLPDDRGQIRATHIEAKDLAEFEAKGFISNLSGTTFTLLLDKNAATGMAVTLGSGISLPVGAVNGSFVEVRTLTAAGGVVTATKVELENELEAAENEKMENEGFVTKLIAPDDLIVNGQQVHTTATTMFVGGIKADLVVGMKVEAEGKVVGGILNATKLVFKENIRVEAIVGVINAATSTTQANLTLLGKNVIITSATDLKGLSGITLVLTTVTAGQQVQIRGFMAANGSDIIATRVDLKDAAPDLTKVKPFLQGPVSLKDGATGTMTILGVSINATNTLFRISTDAAAVPVVQVLKDDFFAQVTPNVTVVKVKWASNDTALPVIEAEIQLSNK